MVEAIFCNSDMEFTEPNHLVLAKLEAVRWGSVHEEGVRLSAFEAEAEPLDDVPEGTEIEVAS